ncbi:MAG: hypothetical protein CMI09_11710 [Oceanospirillaceae bacterium]|nr:hypothetical protein [Oceanospirillaceae bacterium]|tara:strand:- start:922 stop:1134 length:213 start_codon:yes stop_codon:yes gene_type:complete
MLQSRKEAIREGLFGIGFVVLFCTAMIYFNAADVDVGAWVITALFGAVLLALVVVAFGALAAVIGRLFRS